MERVFAVPIQSISPTFSQFSTFGSVVNVIIKNAFVLAGVISFVILVLGGFSVIMGAGAGDTKKLEQGRQAIVGALIGLIVVVTSYWIVQLIGLLTGVDLLSIK